MKSPSAMRSPEAYGEFYEQLGHEYEESKIVYGTRLGRVRYRAVSKEISLFARRGARLLDVGCNDGVYTIPYCELGGSGHGIDISQSLVRKAREKAQSSRVSATFEVADIEEYRPAQEFDLVLLSEILEHLRDPELGVRNALKGLRPGGHLLLTTPLPYRGTWRYLAKLVSRAVLTEPYEFEHLGQRYRHDGYYPLALKEWLEAFGLECVKATTLERAPSVRTPMTILLGQRNLQLHRKVS